MVKEELPKSIKPMTKETKSKMEVGYLPNNGWCIFIPNEMGTAKEIIEFGFESPKEAKEKLEELLKPL